MNSAGGSHDRGRGVRAGIAAFMMWGLLTIYWKQLSDVEAVELIGGRFVSASLVMAVVVSLRGRWPAIGAAFADRALAVRITNAALLLTGKRTS